MRVPAKVKPLMFYGVDPGIEHPYVSCYDGSTLFLFDFPINSTNTPEDWVISVILKSLLCNVDFKVFCEGLDIGGGASQWANLKLCFQLLDFAREFGKNIEFYAPSVWRGFLFEKGFLGKIKKPYYRKDKLYYKEKIVSPNLITTQKLLSNFLPEVNITMIKKSCKHLFDSVNILVAGMLIEGFLG